MTRIGSLLKDITNSLLKKKTKGTKTPAETPSKPAKPPPAKPAEEKKPYEYAKTVDRAALSKACVDKTGVVPREFQLQAAEAMLKGDDLVMNIPTGGGKTLAFSLAAMYKPGCVILVVSPLTALTRDQVSVPKHEGE